MRILTILTMVVGLGSVLHADNMVFDRGLPTANLNNAAGTNRSNVAWGDYSPDAGLNWAIGDDFNLNQAGTVTISDLRVWIVATGNQPPSSMWTDLRLFGGPTAGASGSPSSVTQLSQVSTTGADPNVVISQVTYADGSSYQGSSGNSIDIWQVDFLLNWQVDGNTTYSFFVGDTPTALNTSLYPPGVSPFLSASNAALGGAPAQGSDNLIHDIGWNGSGVQTYETWNSLGNGWDKPSDINVQIFATPEPSSILFLGTVVFFVGSLARRKYQHKG
jgi:hypothetical protein